MEEKGVVRLYETSWSLVREVAMSFRRAGKGFSQIKDLPDSFVAADDVETGYGNKIPLWLLGFLY